MALIGQTLHHATLHNNTYICIQECKYTYTHAYTYVHTCEHVGIVHTHTLAGINFCAIQTFKDFVTSIYPQKLLNITYSVFK